MCPPPFLITASRRLGHSMILLSMKRCENFCHSVTVARFSSSTVLVVDSLLKSTPNSVIHGIRAIRRPHVRFNEVDVLFFRIVHRCPGAVRWRSILLQCPPVMTRYCSDVRQQTLLEDDIAVVSAANFRSGIDEDHPCLPHTRYSDRHHNVATEMFPFTN